MAKKPSPRPKPKPKPKPRPKPKDDCFITTACVKFYGYPDNCNQLQILRFFRDSYLKQSSKGRRLVKSYYLIGPIIIQNLRRDKDAATVFKFILMNINKACLAIKAENKRLATEIYIDVVQTLGMYYRLI